MCLADLRPLLCFRNMEDVNLLLFSFHLGYTFTFDLGNDDISAISLAWPSLRCLKLEMGGRVVALKNFFALLDNYAALEVLRLDIDFRTFGTGSQDMKSYKHKLDLDVGRSPQDEPEVTADLLVHILPGLVSLTHDLFAPSGAR